MSQGQPPRRREDTGFTLIELMVVVLIVAILIAIAIPNLLGARSAAYARSAQAVLRNALAAELVQWSQTQSFATVMSGIERSITWTTGPPATGNVVAVAVGDQDSSGTYYQAVTLAAAGADGYCYYILRSNDPTVGLTGYQIVAQNSGHTCPNPPVPPAGLTGVTLNTTTKASQAPGSSGSGVGNTWYWSW